MQGRQADLLLSGGGKRTVWISRLVLMLLALCPWENLGSRDLEKCLIPPSEMHSVCPWILSWSWLNNPMTLDTRSRVSDIRMLVVKHAQMFPVEVAEDLQLHHRLHVSRPAQHETPGCPIAACSVDPQRLSHSRHC